MKRILKAIFVFAACALTASGCHDKEAELLVSKLYFESSESAVKVDMEESLVVELRSRLSFSVASDVNVTYSIAGEDAVKAYNERFGKEYKFFTDATLSSETAAITAGSVYTDAVEISLSNLQSMTPGATYLLPVKVSTGDVPVIDGTDMTYYLISKPLKVKNVAVFGGSHYIKTSLTPLKVFENATYEAVVCVNAFGENNTVMGCEGVMIMRIGDAGGGTVPSNVLQIAGKSEMTLMDSPLDAKKWYHLAFTCSSEGIGNLYVNGECVIANGSFPMSSDLTAGDDGTGPGFSIGRVPNFDWGDRPFNGMMCEVRLWDVVRTPSQIKENMLSVDPTTPGLVFYYKLNGEISDASGNGILPTNQYGLPTFRELEKPVEIGDTIE